MLNKKAILLVTIIFASLLIGTLEQKGGFRSSARRISGSRSQSSYSTSRSRSSYSSSFGTANRTNYSWEEHIAAISLLLTISMFIGCVCFVCVAVEDKIEDRKKNCIA